MGGGKRREREIEKRRDGEKDPAKWHNGGQSPLQPERFLCKRWRKPSEGAGKEKEGKRENEKKEKIETKRERLKKREMAKEKE